MVSTVISDSESESESVAVAASRSIAWSTSLRLIDRELLVAAKARILMSVRCFLDR